MRLREGRDAVSAKAFEIRPDQVETELVIRAERRIREYLARNPGDKPIEVQAEIGDQETLVVPRQVAVMLAQVLGMLAQGEGVQIMPDRAMLTTQQAADVLNVSRPYVVGLLEADMIPYAMVGTHRRIALADLLQYQRTDYQRRRAVVDELTQLGEELGGD
jgi:excisionase family DNA binding protein